MTEPFTNKHRVLRCDEVLRRYNEDWTTEVNLVDFLADARHWCDVEELSYAKLDRLAYWHYLDELHHDDGDQE